MNFKILTLSLALLMPFALHAMEGYTNVARSGLLRAVPVPPPYYFAEIIDNKDTQLQPVRLRITSFSDGNNAVIENFADYVLTTCHKRDSTDKNLNVEYSIKKDTTEIAQGSVKSDFANAEIQRYVRRLDDKAYLRIIFWTTKESYDYSLAFFRNFAGISLVFAKMRDNNGIELPRTKKDDGGIQFGDYLLNSTVTERNTETMRLRVKYIITKNAVKITEGDQEIPMDELFEKQIDSAATLQIFPFWKTASPKVYLHNYVDINASNQNPDEKHEK